MNFGNSFYQNTLKQIRWLFRKKHMTRKKYSLPFYYLLLIYGNPNENPYKIHEFCLKVQKNNEFCMDFHTIQRDEQESKWNMARKKYCLNFLYCSVYRAIFITFHIRQNLFIFKKKKMGIR